MRDNTVLTKRGLLGLGKAGALRGAFTRRDFKRLPLGGRLPSGEGRRVFILPVTPTRLGTGRQTI
jgi:hypothetical protein